MSIKKNIVWVTVALAVLCYSMQAQPKQKGRGRDKPVLDVPIYVDTTKNIISDSLRFVRDSLHRVDSIQRADSAALMEQNSLKHPAFSSARDSLVEDFSNGRQILKYYGEVSVKYDNMELTADYMEYDVKSQTVYAKGTEDPVTKEVVGSPVMTEGGKTYEMEEVRYNFASRKAFINNMTTTESDGILMGKNIKMMPDRSINITNGKYTVCDCDDPHYYLHMTAAKVMTEPKQNTVFGPSWPVVEGVPLFPIVLPFGFVPKRPERASGLLMPSFGEEAARGFYMRDLGVYFVFGDYVDVSVTGSYFTLGSWGIDFNSRYKVNYHCNGGISVNYSYDQTGIKGEPDFSASQNFGVKWTHQQDSKAHPGSTFSASVNFSSPLNNRYNSHSVTEALNNQTSSSISYSRNWNGKFNLSINALHSQNSQDSSYAFTLPNLTFSVSKFYPFKNKHRVGKEKLYEKFSLSYNTTLQNKVNFKTSQLGTKNFQEFLQNGMQHSFSIGLPNFTLFKYLNVTPSLSYGMNWFFDKTEKVYNPETDKVEDKKGGLFSTLGVTQNYSGAISLDTQIYGLFNFGKHHYLQAVRHIIKPTLSMNFSPESGTYANGWRTLEYTDAKGDFKSMDYNIYAGQIYSAPGKGKSATANFTIGNNLEAKIRDLRDTTGKGNKKVKLLDQCNLTTGYNFLADSLRMNDVGLTISTNVFGKVGINANLNFDPYAVNEKGVKINKFQVEQNGHLLRLKNANLSISYSLSGKGSMNGNTGTQGSSEIKAGTPAYERIYYHPVTGEYIPGGWLYYTNPNSPWSLNFSYSFSYARSYSYNEKENYLKNIDTFNQTLNFSGNVKITPALSIQLTSGFDFTKMKLSTTQVSATYDLHCFHISFSWVPTGKWQSWSFQICANASALADLLKFDKNNSFWDNQ